MRLNRRVPVGTHGGVRGRLSDYEGLLLDFMRKNEHLERGSILIIVTVTHLFKNIFK